MKSMDVVFYLLFIFFFVKCVCRDAKGCAGKADHVVTEQEKVVLKAVAEPAHLVSDINKDELQHRVRTHSSLLACSILYANNFYVCVFNPSTVGLVDRACAPLSRRSPADLPASQP